MFTKYLTQPPASEWCKNKYKYLVIQATSTADDAKTVVKKDVLVCPATIKRDETGAPVSESSIIAFRMSPGQTLILPFHWLYYIPYLPEETRENSFIISGIHDPVTYFLPG
jgi:hypothetical protein